MAGRVGTYVHSDTSSPAKGAAIVAVRSVTDFATRTPEFEAFVAKAAKLAYGASAATPEPEWSDVIAMFPDLEQDRDALSKLLKETITVEKIVCVRV